MSEAAHEINYEVSGVPREYVLKVYPAIEALLKKVVKPQTGFTIDAVVTGLQLGHMQLFVIGEFDGIAITNVQDRPLQRVLWVHFVAGENADEWIHQLHDALASYAREIGAEAIEFAGRPGWKKYQDQFPDYRAVQVVWRKEL